MEVPLWNGIPNWLSLLPIEVTDLNGDSFTDIVLAKPDIDIDRMVVGILLGYGNGSFANQTIHPTGCTKRALMKVADFDNDNRSDVVIIDFSGSM